MTKFVTVEPGFIGVIESIDGVPLPAGRVIGVPVECDNFQDAVAFLKNGGQRGTQMASIPPGKWRINNLVFKVRSIPMTTIEPGQIGIVEAIDGEPLPAGRILATPVECDSFQDPKAFMDRKGQRGNQMAVVPPGQWRINTQMFKVNPYAMTIIESNQIGTVEALDGDALSEGRIIGRQVECDSFQDPKAFMDADGQRGPQMSIIPPGKYRINPKIFSVTSVDIIDIPQGKVGIVTTKEGTPLKTGEIAGPEVGGHNSFQDPKAFIENGGNKGLQEQVLLAGRYFINPYFASVEVKDMTEVPIANVGVVVAFVGKEGQDVTGEGFRHGNMVHKGERGVWIDVLDPGMYPINPFTHSVKLVPTANVVLNWATGKNESHKLDEKLSTITVRSSDGFTFNLDVSQIIHIPRTDAPKVIARFGSMQALVTQVLEPTIGNYFRNAAQNSDAISFLKERTQRQTEAKTAISKALAEYNVGAIETLIGDINPPEALMKTLTDRKIADQEKVTYQTQMEAEGVRQSLNQARALADTQKEVVAAERKVSIADFDKQTAIKKAEGEGEAAKINARANAEAAVATGEAQAKVTTLNGAAEAGKTLAVGNAEAEVIEKKTKAMDRSQYAAVEIARALAGSGKPLVPEIMVAGGAAEGGRGSSLMDVLIAQMVATKVAASTEKK
ncbi:MAG: hypothetical protein KBC81_03605 [Candidatus Pacebacteria bacterium]|nr:hypothetical protein [Candidatus Paceibacterota bacterium]